MLNNKKTEIHGHRGCRGYFPENTLQGFLNALHFNIDAIELDVVVSKDHQVVVSHEHYMHHKKCLWPNFKAITTVQEADLFIYQMNYLEVKTFDCGLLPHPNYPQLQTEKAYKPLLKEIIESVELACLEMKRTPVTYNIEIKSEPKLIGKAQPTYDLYINLIIEVILSYDLGNRVIIQSFDKEVLKTIRKFNNIIPLSLLIEDELEPNEHIAELGFKPEILASDYIYLTKENVLKLKHQNIKVYAFTVNEITAIKKMVAIDVDAIITDYPDVAINCL